MSFVHIIFVANDEYFDEMSKILCRGRATRLVEPLLDNES